LTAAERGGAAATVQGCAAQRGDLNGRGLNEVGAVFSSDGMTIQFDRGAVWERCVPPMANI